MRRHTYLRSDELVDFKQQMMQTDAEFASKARVQKQALLSMKRSMHRCARNTYDNIELAKDAVKKAMQQRASLKNTPSTFESAVDSRNVSSALGLLKSEMDDANRYYVAQRTLDEEAYEKKEAQLADLRERAFAGVVDAFLLRAWGAKQEKDKESAEAEARCYREMERGFLRVIQETKQQEGVDDNSAYAAARAVLKDMTKKRKRNEDEEEDPVDT